MCGRYACARNVDDIAAAFGVGACDTAPATAVAPSWNIAPTATVTIVVQSRAGRQLVPACWGLVPSWARDPSIGARCINARLETAGRRPAYRQALRSRRCLLPADGWYEWARDVDGRRPHYLTSADGAILAFAGLWERWRGADGRELVTATILTGAAPVDLAAIHDRAPVLLGAHAWDDWLDPTAPPGAVAALLQPTPAGTVVSWPVGDEVGDVRAQGPHLRRAVPVPDQARLF